MDFYEFSLLLREYLKDVERNLNQERAKWGQEPVYRYNKVEKKLANGYDLINFLSGGE